MPFQKGEVNFFMGIVNKLITIKRFREEKAEIELLKAKQDFLLKESAYLKERQKLSEFVIACERREKEMYAELYKKLVFQKDIDDVLFNIQQMKDETESLKEKVNSAREEKEMAYSYLGEAKIAHQEAIRMREKFEEIRTIHEQEREIELLRIEDVEMEEAGTAKFFQGETTT